MDFRVNPKTKKFKFERGILKGLLGLSMDQNPQSLKKLKSCYNQECALAV